MRQIQREFRNKTQVFMQSVCMQSVYQSAVLCGLAMVLSGFERESDVMHTTIVPKTL